MNEGSLPRKGTPVQVRFNQEEEAFIANGQEKFGMSKSEMIRRCVAYTLPKFISGEVNLLTLVNREEPAR